MKIVVAVFADFEQTFLGGRARLGAVLAGQTVIARTLQRLVRIEGPDARCLFVRPRDQDSAGAAVRNCGLEGRLDVLPLDDGRRPRRELLRSARKWNLDSWRGSPLGTTWFDEFVEPRCVAAVLDHYHCEGVLCLDGHMPALDADIATAMIAQQRARDLDAKLLFAPAPPGLAGILLRREVTRELLEQDVPVGLLLSYRPEMPRPDPLNQPTCFQTAPQIANTAARLTADTRRSHELLCGAFADLGDQLDAVRLCDWLRQTAHDRAGPLPVEVELELTTDDPLPQTTLRPRGDRVPRRQLADSAAVERLARELAVYDDRLLILGGHGDPLAHPQFAEICRRIRAAGVCGLGVVTPLVELSEPNREALFAAPVDILQVRLDANSPETYRRVHQGDHFEHVLANIERIERLRRERLSAQPIIACSLTRCAATLPDMEAFYDRWIRATGCAVIEGYSDFGGALPADTLLSTEPPVREPCRRLAARLMLLADGAAVLCDQDIGGVLPIGNWLVASISDIWNGKELRAAREKQNSLRLQGLRLCGQCSEWFRQ